MSRALTRFSRNRPALAGAVLVLILAIAALMASGLDRHTPYGKNSSTGLTELGAPKPPSGEFPLGTDMLGRCVAARLYHGARLSLQVALLATLIAALLGVVAGLAAGFLGGGVDAALMRIVDLILAFPFLLLSIALAAALRGSGAAGTTTVLCVLGIVGWTSMARVVRGKVLTLREMEFVQAARALGAPAHRVLARHILPNVVGPVVVMTTISVAQMILAESTLSYLGLGAAPPEPSWGRMLYEGQPYLRGAPWLVFAPGAAVLVAVLGFNLLGDGLRDALDPKER